MPAALRWLRRGLHSKTQQDGLPDTMGRSKKDKKVSRESDFTEFRNPTVNRTLSTFSGRSSGGGSADSQQLGTSLASQDWGTLSRDSSSPHGRSSFTASNGRKNKGGGKKALHATKLALSTDGDTFEIDDDGTDYYGDDDDTFESERPGAMKKKHSHHTKKHMTGPDSSSNLLDTLTCGCFRGRHGAGSTKIKTKAKTAQSILQFDALVDTCDGACVTLTGFDGSAVSTDKPKDLEVDLHAIPLGEEVDDPLVLEKLESRLAKAMRKIHYQHDERTSNKTSGLTAAHKFGGHNELVDQLKAEINAIKVAQAADEAAKAAAVKQMIREGQESTEGDSPAAQRATFTVESTKSLGVDWHWQNGRAVAALIREGGAAADMEGERKISAGMVLKEFRSKSTKKVTKADLDTIRGLLLQRGTPEQKSQSAEGGRLSEYLSALLEIAGRPLQLVFERPGFDGVERRASSVVDTSVEEMRLGCAIRPLEYTVPAEVGSLGACFWQMHGHLLFIGDVEKPSVFVDAGMHKEGLRAGLVLAAIASSDGYTRDMQGFMTHAQRIQQIAMMQRPFTCFFEPTPRPMEFTFSDATCAKATPEDKAAVKARSRSGGPSISTGWSIFRELGLSLVEEDVSSWAANQQWRVRVCGVHPGGGVDRFNRKNDHAWVTPGLTLVSVRSPCVKQTSVKGWPLQKLAELCHCAASGQQVMAPGERVLEGKEITLGFAVSSRAKTLDLLKWMS